MYHVMKTYVHTGDELFDWCCNITEKANSLENAALFRMRNVITAVRKEPAVWTQNEQRVMDEVTSSAILHHKQIPDKDHFFLSYTLLDKVFRDTDSPDFFADGLPRQSAQQAIKRVRHRMKGFFAAKRRYHVHPEEFTGEPRLPHYHKSGGRCTAILTNEDCVVYHDSGRWTVKLPLTKTRLHIGEQAGKLKQAEVKPTHGIFMIVLIFDDGMPEPAFKSDRPRRIAAMDMGVDNLAAVTSNTGNPGLIIRGGAAKALNQLYNKRTAAIRSQQAKGGTKKFVSTAESRALDLERETKMYDIMHKSAAMIMNWLEDNDIDTFVCGCNRGWKTGSDMDKRNNQNFVQIPFSMLAKILEYRCVREGIRFVRQEESYTSRASYPDNDPIPVYRKD